MDAAATETPRSGEDAVARARYYSPANIFKVERPAIPRHAFVAERDRAMAPGSLTRWFALDIGERLGLDEPATTPLMLARYGRIGPGATLSGMFRASGEFYFAITGSGRASKGADAFEWETGDVFSLPGGGETELVGGEAGAVLLQVTNEPELSFHGLDVPRPDASPTAAVRYPRAAIARQMELMRPEQEADPDRSGRALHLTSAQGGRADAAHPTIKLAMNSLDPHSVQRPHRHNSAALTLPIRASKVHSVVEGERIDWRPYALMITPPGELHEHRNDGEDPMLSLVIQDGGLYFRCRTIGFSFE